jgi:phospholipid/cholesterol/gamma-HCH transport system ATP-binding protein
MISVKDLSVSFSDKPLFEGITFDVNDGSIVALIGRNGSGKTVLLKTVAGLIDPDKGTVMIDGVPTGRRLYDSVQSQLGYVFQKGGLFDSMNVYDNIAFGMRRKGSSENDITISVTDVLARVGLSGNEERYPSELSGGMQKRVCLARALCLRPKNILYDDPTAGLDPVLTDSIGELILELHKQEGMTAILVSHDLALIEKVADYIYLLYDGRMVFSGKTADFFNKNDSYSRQFIDGLDDESVQHHV